MDRSSLQEISIPQFEDTEGVLDTVGEGLDVVSGLGSIINLVLEAVLVHIAGVFIAILSSIITRPAVWLESNNDSLHFLKFVRHHR
ncbi:MAG: hypothetical protein ABI120_24060 [Gemmatimonadaceae bacterium]